MTLLLITGHSAAGKTTAAEELQELRPDLIVFDQDRVCAPLTGAALSLVGVSSHSRGGIAYARLRDAEYVTLLRCAEAVLSRGKDVALVAPFWPEMNGRENSSDRDFHRLAAGLGHEVRSAWLTCSPATRRARLLDCGLAPAEAEDDNTTSWIATLQDPPAGRVDRIIPTDDTPPADVAVELEKLL